MLAGSYHNGFAPRDGVPLYPELWSGCVGAWAPCLGPTGLTLRDWSGFQRHGTLTNMDASSDWMPQSGRYSLDFDGTNDHIVTAFVPVTVGPITYSVWCRPSRFTSFQSIMSSRTTDTQSFELFTNVNGFTGGRYTVSSNWDVVAAETVTNVWYHVAVIRAGGFTSIYKNGVLVQSVTSSANTASTAVLTIGARVGALNPFQGQIDDARVYHRELSSTEIRLLASRRGIAYDLAPRRRGGVFTSGGFKAYWAARRAQIIGGGLQ